MFDKSFTIKTVNEVIKDMIIPNLSNDMAKEQGIALLAVLKNLDTNTVENTNPKEQLTLLITQTLNEFFQRIEGNPEDCTKFTWLEELRIAMNDTEFMEDVTEKWKALNEIQCRMLRFLYSECTVDSRVEAKYITPFRKRLREQLSIELALVR